MCLFCILPAASGMMRFNYTTRIGVLRRRNNFSNSIRVSKLNSNAGARRISTFARRARRDLGRATQSSRNPE